MSLDTQTLRSQLCDAFCQSVDVWSSEGATAIALPMTARDGDHITVYVEPHTGGWRISDRGTTLMRLSYEHDLTKLLAGPRERIYQSMLSDGGLAEEEGDIFLDVPADDLMRGLFVLGQGVSRIEGLTHWTRKNVESTFFDDLRRVLRQYVPEQSLIEDYVVPGVDNGENYAVDFYIKTPIRPLYLFGVGNRDKARLTTIFLQHLQAEAPPFESMVVCQDFDALPAGDRSRLLKAANDIVPSIHDETAIRQKIAHRMS